MKRLFTTFAVMIVALSSAVFAQQVSPKQAEVDPRTSEAYSLLIQRKAKLQSELETLLREYSGEWPAAKQLRFELDSLKGEMEKMAAVDQSKVSKLTAGYGGLILRKVSLSGEIDTLLREQSSEWPTTKERQRELELLDREIQKIMT
jgi:peptidoglycan hydrolase CwlO-like protein